MNKPNSKPSHQNNFWAQLERDGLSALTASFREKKTEAAYIQHLVETRLKHERSIWWAVIITFFLFAVLDFLTIRENLNDIITLRVIVGILVLAMVPFSYLDRLKPYFGYMSALGMLAFATSIIAMISIMPAEGAPPYIIGVLVTFIASSCLMRIQFLVASSVYLAASAIYLAVLNLDSDFQRVEIISGHFFMISIAVVAIVTIYNQEIRSRVLWRRDQQRTADADYIERLLIEATAADQSKINFLSMMSHELRTPLHQIIGFSEIVTNSFRGANDDQENIGHLGQIQTSAQMLLARIQKMLRYADATAGKIKYDLAVTSVRELVDSSLEQLRTGFEKKGIRIDSSDLEDAKLYIDIFHTCYALNNLFENALNASAVNGRIWISGKINPDNSYDIEVKDEGVGMTEEQLEKALKPFTQAEQVLDRSREGVGLGLTLANHIFSGQNASLEIESDPLVGTTVTIRFENPSATATQSSV